jgi:hypothetical protein
LSSVLTTSPYIKYQQPDTAQHKSLAIRKHDTDGTQH